MSQLPESISELMNNSKKELDVEEKLCEYMLNDTDLVKKTELEKPFNWTILSSIIDYLKLKNMPFSAKILENFKDTAYRTLISKDRKGRLELQNVLQSLIQRTQQQLEEKFSEKISSKISMKVK